MANHCSLVNRTMAEALLAGSEDFLSATSDVYAHETIATLHRNLTMFPPISYDLSCAMRVPSTIRAKGAAGDDPLRSATVDRDSRVDFKRITVWAASVTWAPLDRHESRVDGHRHANRVVGFGGAVGCQKWSDIKQEWWRISRADLQGSSALSGLAMQPKLQGHYFVTDPQPPPAWIYSGRWAYVGDARQRPRGFFPVSSWIADSM